MRREAVRSWLLLFGLLAVGAGLVLSIRHLSPLRLPRLAEGIMILLPAVVFFIWPRKPTPSDLRLCPLSEFLATSDHLFAPNQPEGCSGKVAAWISSFARRHTNAVLVGVQADDAHIADTVFLFGALLPEDATAASELGAAVRSVSARSFARRFPSVKTSQQPIHEIIWD